MRSALPSVPCVAQALRKRPSMPVVTAGEDGDLQVEILLAPLSRCCC